MPVDHQCANFCPIYCIQFVIIHVPCKVSLLLLLLLYLFVSFTIIISWRAPSNLISGKPVSQYALYSLIFSPLRSVINWEQHEKYPYNQSSHTRKYTEWSIADLSTSKQLQPWDPSQLKDFPFRDPHANMEPWGLKMPNLFGHAHTQLLKCMFAYNQLIKSLRIASYTLLFLQLINSLRYSKCI